jgi:hypothetical protein
MRKTFSKESTLAEILSDVSIPVVTRGRTEALANVNRWGGWTTRPYSVLEHSVIGASVLLHNSEALLALVFLLHDYEESEFGDIVTPIKHLYTNTAYDLAVERFNIHLFDQAGVDAMLVRHPLVKRIDEEMAWAENRTVATRGDPRFDDAHPDTVTATLAVDMIESQVFASPENAILKFWRLYDELANRDFGPRTSATR